MNQNAQHPLRSVRTVFISTPQSVPQRAAPSSPPCSSVRSSSAAAAAGAGKCQWIYYHCGLVRGAPRKEDRKKEKGLSLCRAKRVRTKSGVTRIYDGVSSGNTPDLLHFAARFPVLILLDHRKWKGMDGRGAHARTTWSISGALWTKVQ